MTFFGMTIRGIKTVLGTSFQAMAPRATAARRADHHPFSSPTVPGLSIHRGGRHRFTHTTSGRPWPPAGKPAQDNESTNQLGKADT